MGSARALLPLPAAAQSELARVVVQRGLSTRQTEALVRRHQAGNGEAGRKQATTRGDPDVQRLDGILSRFDVEQQ